MIIAITGHRPDKLGRDYALKSPLIQRIKIKIIEELHKHSNEPDLRLMTGMALGIDTLFALIALQKGLPFIAAIPCLNQHKVWLKSSQDLYNKILSSHLCIVKMVSTKPYYNGCMQERNEWMVDHCDLLIGVWNGSAGGTLNCIQYARTQRKEIVLINPNEI